LVVPPEADKNSLPRFAPPDKLKAALFSDETSWQKAAGIILGTVNILGIGFREETLFRRVIGNNLGIACEKDLRGVWKAVIISGLIFGLSHLTNIFSGVNPARALIQVASACAIGMYYTAVYFRGGNLWSLVLIHCLTDAGGLFRSAFTTAETTVGVINNRSITGMVMIPIYLGITVFLLRKKKMDAVFENLKQASEYDRKVSGMNY
jgi:membrane protease YdiL (CAAX protease family)